MHPWSLHVSRSRPEEPQLGQNTRAGICYIELINPKLILVLGSVAVKQMLGAKNVEEARGKLIERDGGKYLASYHPAVRFHREDLAQKIKLDFAFLMKELKRL